MGETVAADIFFKETGGKGTNQALTARKLGSDVSLIGCVGNDAFAVGLIETYRQVGLDISALRTDAENHTGIAFVLINDDGDNMISIAPGANFTMTSNDFEDNIEIIKDCGIMGFQFELNIDFVEYGIKRAKSLGIRTLLDPAPARKLDEAVYPYLDFIKPNETEARFLTGVEVTDPDSAYGAAKWFLDKGVGTAIITLGENGVVVMNDNLQRHISAPKVEAQDPTAAGDIFSGALMHCLAENMDLIESCEFAVFASAKSVQSLGAIDAMPEKQDVLDFMASFK